MLIQLVDNYLDLKRQQNTSDDKTSYFSHDTVPLKVCFAQVKTVVLHTPVQESSGKKLNI